MAKTTSGHPELTPVLIAEGASQLLAFLKTAFGAVEKEIYPGEEGKIAHGEVRIGGALLMLCDPSPEFPAQTARLFLYVDDVDAAHGKAVAAGAKDLGAPETAAEYGMRVGRVHDRWGNYWTLAQAL